MPSRRHALALALALSTAPALADSSDLVIPLKFVPTSKPGQVAAVLHEGVSTRAVAIDVEDARAVKSKDLVGEGTSDNDEVFKIRAAGHLPSFARATIQDRLSAWGVVVDPTSNLVLAIKMTRYFVRETNQVFGSTYQAEVQIPFVLKDRAGTVFAEGTALGNASQRGRKRNAANCSEVLSNAFELAAANLMNASQLQEAWLQAKPQPGTAVAARPAGDPARPATPSVPVMVVKPVGSGLTPAQLLVDVNKLRRQQLGTNVLVAYVSKQTLAAGFSADDLVAWKRAGIPEPVMQAALRRAP